MQFFEKTLIVKEEDLDDLDHVNNVRYVIAAKLNDTIHIRTHIEKSRGAISIRVVEMFDSKTNRLLVRSSTEWCLLDSNKLKPIRITEDIKNTFKQ